MEPAKLEKDSYTPRNAVVAAKEKLYDKINLSVRQIDIFIAACAALIVLLVVFGMR